LARCRRVHDVRPEFTRTTTHAPFVQECAYCKRPGATVGCALRTALEGEVGLMHIFERDAVDVSTTSITIYPIHADSQLPRPVCCTCWLPRRCRAGRCKDGRPVLPGAPCPSGGQQRLPRESQPRNPTASAQPLRLGASACGAADRGWLATTSCALRCAHSQAAMRGAAPQLPSLHPGAAAGGLVTAQADRDRLVAIALAHADARGHRCGVCSSAFLPAAIDPFAPEPPPIGTLTTPEDDSGAVPRAACCSVTPAAACWPSPTASGCCSGAPRPCRRPLRRCCRKRRRGVKRRARDHCRPERCSCGPCRGVGCGRGAVAGEHTPGLDAAAASAGGDDEAVKE